MRRRQSVTVWVISAVAIAFLSCPAKPTSWLIYNPTASAPEGWYWVTSASDLHVDDYVLARLSGNVARLAEERHYLPTSVPLLKRLGAIRKQQVCRSGDTIFVDGEPVVVVLRRDSRGRMLVGWSQCRALNTDELFLLSRSNPASFDSRYFGPIAMQNVIGKAIPLWTW